jgi:hypothetical protein
MVVGVVGRGHQLERPSGDPDGIGGVKIGRSIVITDTCQVRLRGEFVENASAGDDGWASRSPATTIEAYACAPRSCTATARDLLRRSSYAENAAAFCDLSPPTGAASTDQPTFNVS